MQQEPEDGRAWGNLAACQMRLNDYTHALTASKEAVRHLRDNVEMWYVPPSLPFSLPPSLPFSFLFCLSFRLTIASLPSSLPPSLPPGRTTSPAPLAWEGVWMSSMLFIDCWIYDKPSRAVARPATVGKKGGREGGREEGKGVWMPFIPFIGF